MPELPEVETVARFLREGGREGPPILGKRIVGARLFWERTLAAPSPEEFLSRVVGQTILSIGRRAKYLVLELSEDTLLVHLRMTGDLFVETQQAEIAPHHRLVLDLDGGLRLSFNDTRKFGRVWLTGDPGSVLAGLGPEPLDPEFTAERFHTMLRERRRQLKPLLLDQSFIAGLGNIYVDEALFLARLHPLTVASSLTKQEAERLWAAIRQVLTAGIRSNGTSLDWVYRGGEFQNYLRAYGRTGEPCSRCGTPIERLVVGQRGTHICPNCQQLPTSSP